jgi:Family of unknown function (DUF6077)
MTRARLASTLEGGLYFWAVAVASWTVCYHIALVLGLTRNITAALWIVLTAAISVWLFSRPRGSGTKTESVSSSSRPAIGFATAATAIAVSMAIFRPVGSAFTVAWAAMLVLLLLAAVDTLRRPTEAAPTHPSAQVSQGPALRRAGLFVVVALAVISAVLSASVLRPDADDVFLVNRSTHTEQDSGEFAVRDTIFADEVLASSRPPNPQIAVESMIGTVAAALPVNASTTTYLLWGPLVSALAVIALWRLLRTLHAPAPELALAIATAFLLLNGDVNSSLGNFGVVRSWQGKAALLMIVVPLLWHLGLRFGRSGKSRDLILLAAANVAAVGLSSSGIFIAPTITAVAVLSSVAWLDGRAAIRRLGLGAAATVYPVGAALMTLVAEPQNKAPQILAFLAARTSTVTSPAAEWPWYTVLGSGWGLGLAILAILLAWLTVTDRTARLALIAAPLAVLILFTAPGSIERLDAVFSSDSVLWRSIWIMPVPAAIGLLLSSPALLERSQLRNIALIVVPLAALGGLALTQTHTLSTDNGVTITSPTWDIDPGDRVALDQIMLLTEPGDLVAAPEPIGGAIAITTVQIRAINPRNTATDAFSYVDEFNSDLRLLLSWGVAFGIPDERYDDTRSSLGILGVDLLCIRPELNGQPITDIVSEEGYVNVVTDGECMYWRKLGTS